MNHITRDLDKLNKISYRILGSVFAVHTELGPGLLESTYEVCLAYELRKQGLFVIRQQILPVMYKEIKLDAGYRIDLLIEDSIILEIKSVEKIIPIHQAQLLTYLKLARIKLGFLLNFNVSDMKEGITRMIM